MLLVAGGKFDSKTQLDYTQTRKFQTQISIVEGITANTHRVEAAKGLSAHRHKNMNNSHAHSKVTQSL